MSLESPPRLKDSSDLGQLLRAADSAAMSPERLAANGAAVKATIAGGLAFAIPLAKIGIIAALIVGGVVVQQRTSNGPGAGYVATHRSPPATGSVKVELPAVVEPPAVAVAPVSPAAVVEQEPAGVEPPAVAVARPATVERPPAAVERTPTTVPVPRAAVVDRTPAVVDRKPVVASGVPAAPTVAPAETASDSAARTSTVVRYPVSEPAPAPPSGGIATTTGNASAPPPPPTAEPLPPSDLPEQLKLYEAAKVAKANKQFSVGLARLDELVRKFPATPLRADVELARAELLILGERLEEAAHSLEALAADPSHRGRRGELLRTLGDVRRKQNDCTRAIDAYTRARAAGLSASETARVDRGVERCAVR